VFVAEGTGMTYDQLKQHGLKRSARDMVVSMFLRDTVGHLTRTRRHPLGLSSK
jgi:hypothetical protein